MTRQMAIVTLFLCPLSLVADNSIKTRWEQLCTAVGGRRLSISTVQGETVQGKCMSTDATTVRLNQGAGQVVSVERTGIKQITAKDPHHALSLIWEYCLGAITVLEYTPIGPPLAFILAPVVATGGVIASPIALLLDLFEVSGRERVEVLAP